jgi:hypothetical protein
VSLAPLEHLSNGSQTSDLPPRLRSEGEIAIKELCESLEATRGLLAERAGQAQLETTGLEPLPQDRRSLAFVQAVFKHNFSPSNIDDAILALKDFQFEVESCQQTTELAFQQVWRVYDIVKSRTLQRRSSVSTVSTISTLIPESSTEPQARTSFRTEVIDWLKRQDVASKSHSETSRGITQTGREVQTGTSAEDTYTPDIQPMAISRDQGPSRNRIRNIFRAPRAKHDYKKAELGAYGDYKKIEPFYFGTPLPPQQSPHATEQPVHSSHDVLSQQPPLTNITTYGQEFQTTAAQPVTWHSQTIYPRVSTDEDRVPIGNVSASIEQEAVSMSQSQVPLPVPEGQTFSAPVLPPNAAYGVGSLGTYTFKHGPAGVQPPSQPWSNTSSPAVLTEESESLTNGIAWPPPTHGHASGDSVEYSNGRSGAESHGNDGDDSIHYEEKDKRWGRGLFGSSKDRERGKEDQKELTRMIGKCRSARH